MKARHCRRSPGAEQRPLTVRAALFRRSATSLAKAFSTGCNWAARATGSAASRRRPQSICACEHALCLEPDCDRDRQAHEAFWQVHHCTNRAARPRSRRPRERGAGLDVVSMGLPSFLSLRLQPAIDRHLSHLKLVHYRFAERMHQAVSPSEDGGGQNKVETLQLVKPVIGQCLNVGRRRRGRRG